MQLESFVLGTSGSLPLPRRSLTSILLRREGDEILFDCGEGMQISLRIMHVRWKNLKVICISHSHADHVTGLPGILMLSSQVEREKPLLIVCPYAVKQYIETTKEYLGIYLNYKIQYCVLEDIREGVVFEDKMCGYYIYAFQGNHTRPVWGFIMQEHDRPGRFYPEQAKSLQIPVGHLWAELQRGRTIVVDGKTINPQQVLGETRPGRKIVYVTDTRPSKSISHHMSNSDMVFCEAMFKHEHIEQAQEKKHMTSIEAASMIKAAGGVKQAGLLHFSPRYSYIDIQALESEAQKIYEPIFCCKERSCIEIPYS